MAAALAAAALTLLVGPASAFVVVGSPGVGRTASASSPSTRVSLSAASSASEEGLHRSLLEAQLRYNRSTSAVSSPSASSSSPDASTEEKKGPMVYVGNLPFTATESEIRTLFESTGIVGEVKVPLDRDTGNGRGFAFVSMPDRGEMESAVEALDRTSFGGRTIYVNESKPKDIQKEELEQSKLYVGNISYDTTRDDLLGFFSELGYEADDVYIPLDRDTGYPRGFAFVNMSPEKSADAMDAANGAVMKGRTLTVSISLPRGQKASPSGKKSETKLYVGNLSFYTDVESVRALFEEYGPVQDCYMPLDRDTGRPRGFAFVTMDPEAADRAADETDGYEMDGRIIRVNEAQPKGRG